MPHRVVQSILHDRRIAYAITDRDLHVIEVSGGSNGLQTWLTSWLGRSLTDVVPELIGSEEALADILTGELPRLQTPWINRDLPGDAAAYITMVDLPHLDDAGRIAGIIHVIQDVTEVGQLEQRLTQQRNNLRLLQEELHQQNLRLEAANAELRRLDDVKSAFVSIAAHELRTPLASISGYLEMLLDGDAGPLTIRQSEYLHILEGSAQRLLRITRDLLDLTRIEAGRLEMVLYPTDMVRLVETVIAEQALQLEAKAQHLCLRAPVSLPLALCDRARAAQVVGNLLSNASKYSPPGATITLEVALARGESGFLDISVADEGIGIAEEDRSHLFDPFFRARNATKTGASGAGLGLYIAHSLVELHGGRLWFDSLPGKGSTFHATFPIAGSS